MKIKKLLKVVLVAPSYIVVEENGDGVKINVPNSETYAIGDMYEKEETLTESPVYNDWSTSYDYSSSDEAVENKNVYLVDKEEEVNDTIISGENK